MSHGSMVRFFFSILRLQKGAERAFVKTLTDTQKSCLPILEALRAQKRHI